jgi:hypothetical protein
MKTDGAKGSTSAKKEAERREIDLISSHIQSNLFLPCDTPQRYFYDFRGCHSSIEKQFEIL